MKPAVDRENLVQRMYAEGVSFGRTSPLSLEATWAPLLVRWQEEQQKACDKGEMTRVAYQLACARLYEDADWAEQAYDAYYDALDVEEGESDDDAIAACEAGLRKFSYVVNYKK